MIFSSPHKKIMRSINLIPNNSKIVLIFRSIFNQVIMKKINYSMIVLTGILAAGLGLKNQVNAQCSEYSGLIGIIPSRTLCPNEPLEFNSYDDAENFSWDLGDGTIVSGKSAYHTFTAPGTYLIQLTLTNECEQDTIFYDTVHVESNLHIPSSAGIDVQPSKTLCPGEMFNLISQADVLHYEWQFSDSTKYYEYAVNKSFTDTGKHYVQLTFANGCGNDTIVYDTVRVTDNIPISGFIDWSISETTVCPGENIEFSVNDDYAAYHWDFSDGTTSELQFIKTKKFSSEGDHPVILTITNGCGFDTTVTDTVHVRPDIRFSGSLNFSGPGSTPFCPNYRKYFYMSDVAASYSWDMGDGSPPYSDRSIYHIYSSPGDYNVALTLTNHCGIDTVLYDSVFVADDLPVKSNISMDIEPRQACPGDKITFSSSQGDAVSWVWSFGDGDTNTLSYITRRYNTPGKYNLSLRALNGCGNDTILINSLEIKNNAGFEGVVDWNINPKEICPGETVEFDCYDEAIFYKWDFGDGLGSSSQNPNDHKYDSLGAYHISLKLTNGCGIDTIVQDSVIVRNNLYYDNNININLSSQEICPGEIIEFNHWENAVNTLWNFGDGYISRVTNAKHSYNESGEYKITLNLENGCGHTTSVDDYIYIKDNLPVNNDISISAYPGTEVCPGDNLQFYVNNADAKDLLWNFGDGGTSTADFAFHSYPSAGNWGVTLDAANTCGSDTTLHMTIRVRNDAPSLFNTTFYNSMANEVCPGDTFVTIVMPSGGDYSWDFGDGTEVTEPAEVLETQGFQFDLFKHAYQDTGLYFAKITINNGCGYTKIDSLPVNVSNSADLVPSLDILEDSYLEKDSVVYFAVGGGSVYYWDFDDGNYDTTYGAASFHEHIYENSGNYTLRLETRNSCGNSVELTEFLQISSPDDGYIVTDSTICGGDSVEFFGRFYKETGEFPHYQSSDSLFKLKLTVNPSYNDTLDTTFCQGTFIQINGTNYATPGI